jgi:uracil-DNA glycosylase family 4
MLSRKHIILNAMGILRWREKDRALPAINEKSIVADFSTPTALATSISPSLCMPNKVKQSVSLSAQNLSDTSLDWPSLKQRVMTCTRCSLCNSRTQSVFEAGVRQARCLVVGEAPGADEDAYGEPFVGQAGKLLDNMLASVGLSRQTNVYICNVLKCRPPGNRNPTPPEVQECSAYLMRQIELVAPDVLLLMGRFAAQSLLHTEASLSSLRGRVHEIKIGNRNIQAVVSYHPAYLLRNMPEKIKSWADLLLAKQLLTS